MYPLVVVSFFWLLPLALTLDAHLPLDCVPRKTVPYHRENGRMFGEEGVWNYSTMLLREDLGLLLLGARENIYALDINNISNKKSSVSWKVTEKQQKECSSKGKNQIECQNYIRVLHTMEDGRMYVCGTKAFNPECDYMSYKDGELTLENKAEDGKGKCPFDPFQRFSSIMIDKTLYSATSMNFLGSEPVVMRSSPSSIRTEFKSSWLHEPNFISMAQMPESRNSLTGDDDKVYLFFTETAVEYDFYSKLVVSRVARVCKGDLGGQRTLQKKWTSFLKARVDCPVLESQLPYIIQDTYRWCEEGDWRSCVFYAVFTSQSDRVDLSAVCAYRVLDIGRVFSEGKYKTPVTVETSFVKWVMYSGAVPSPRPGACIDDEARNQGISQTLDLPDRTLQFIRDRPLMDQAVLPMGERPLLVRRGTAFTRIIVHRTQALDGKKYHVMFIGTEVGSVLKALNYDKEMFIIEEVQLFQPREPIKVLRFSNTTTELWMQGLTVQDIKMVAQVRPLHGSGCGQQQEAVGMEMRPETFPIFRTQENDPACQSEQHLGQYYTVPPSHFHTVFPHGLPPRYQQQVKMFNEGCVMVRQPALELISHLKRADYSKPTLRYLLYGVKGSGKTMSLCHTVHYCSTQGWLVLHIPDAHLWVKNCKELLPSSYHASRFDQPIQASNWLRNFRTTNEHFLSKIKLRQRYVWTKRESTEEGRPLGELVDMGVSRVKSSSDVVGAVLKELRLQAGGTEGGFRLAVAVDGVNGLWGRTTLKKEDKSPVAPEELTLVHNLRKMINNDWCGGAVIATLSQTGSLYAPSSAYLPQELLGEEGFDSMDPFVPVPVSLYSEKEFESCYLYYLDRHWLQHPHSQTEEGKKELIFLSNRNPSVLERLCAFL